MQPPSRLYDFASRLLEAVRGHYVDQGLEELPERCYVSPGLPAWDFCDTCGGQLVVYLDRTFGSDGTNEQITPLEDLFVRSAEFLIEIALPVATLDDAGDPPTAKRIDEDAQLLLRQPTNIVNAVVDAYNAGELAGCRGLIIMGWESLGPDGGFAGGRLRVRWQLTERR